MKKISSILASLALVVTLMPAMEVKAETASLYIQNTTLNFSAAQGVNPASQVVQLSNFSSTVPANWTASKTSVPSGWFSINPGSGTVPVSSVSSGFTVSINTTGLAAGSYFGSIAVTGNFGQIDLAVNLTVTSSLQITTTNLPNATIGQPYSTKIQVSGGVAPYTWSTESTTYPSACCVLGLNGTASPTYDPEITFNTQSSATVIATYPAGVYYWTFKVTDGTGATATKTLALTINSNLQITTTNLPNATVGQAYSTQVQASGGTAPYTWSVVSTTYPSACCVLGIDTSTGVFNTQSSATVLGPAGSYNWVVKITDANGNTATKTLYLIINPAPNTSGAFSLTKLSFDFYATEGDTAYQYQSLEFTNVSGANLTYTLSVNNQPAWLNTSYNTNPLTAYAGVPTGLGAQINPTNLPAGKYSTSIKISGSFSGSPVIVPVNLTIYPKLPSVPQPISGPAHPSNTNILGPDGTVYLIQGGYRSPYTSAGAFLSYGFNTWAGVVPATTGDMNLPLSNYTPSGSTNTATYFIPPRNGSLINDRGTVYLITNGLRIGFASEQAFLGLGYSYATVKPGDTSFMVALAPINSSAMSHPDGTLVNDNGTIYIMKNNTKMGFPSLQVFYSWGLELNEVVPANSFDRAAPVSGLVNTRMANQLSI